jgi:hypothetical protein
MEGISSVDGSKFSVRKQMKKYGAHGFVVRKQPLVFLKLFMNGKQKNIEQVVMLQQSILSKKKMLQQSKFDMDWKHILPFNSLPKKRI